MKKILFLTCLSIGSMAVFAQNTFFLQPVAGIGAANVSRVDDRMRATSDDYAINFDAGLMAGYRAGKWVLSTGLVYLRTGAKEQAMLMDLAGNQVGTTYIHYRYNHLMLPLEVGRRFALGKKLTLTPSAGAGLSYNISASEKDDFENRISHVPKATYNNYTNTFSCYGLVQAELAWRINAAFDLTCAPAFNYMVSNMIWPQLEPNTVFQHDYTLLLNFGVKWHIPKRDNRAGNKTVPGAR